MRFPVRALSLAFLLTSAGVALADQPGDPAAVKENDKGEWFDAQGNPTYKIEPDGKVDWFTYSGFRRYHAECHVCHGPDGEGSTYAPALKDSLKRFDYPEFAGIVIGGRKNITSATENVMPAFGDNKNVMCYLDDLYVYLRARSTEAVPRGRPAGRVDKTPAATEAEKACLAGS